MSATETCFNWEKITDKFENAFSQEFGNSDKKVHFDNLPEDMRVVDGAKILWCNLMLLDAVISILVTETARNSSRRSFNQVKVVSECIMSELAVIYPDIMSEINTEKNLEAAKGRRKYITVSETLSKALAEKFSYIAVNAPLENPWNSIGNLRDSVQTGPASKAKQKFINITDLLMTHEALARYEFNMDEIIRTVVFRVVFVHRNFKVSLLSPLITVAAALTTSVTAKNKLKRVYKFDDDKMKKRVSSLSTNSFLFPLIVAAPLAVNNPTAAALSSQFSNESSSSSSSSVNTVTPLSVFIPTVEKLEATVPMQLATSLIPLPMLADSYESRDFDIDLLMDCFDVDTVASDNKAAEKARKAAEKLLKLKDKRLLKKLLKAQNASQTEVPIVILKTKNEVLTAVIPVLPLALLEGDALEDVSISSDEMHMALFGEDDGFSFLDDDLLMDDQDAIQAVRETKDNLLGLDGPSSAPPRSVLFAPMFSSRSGPMIESECKADLATRLKISPVNKIGGGGVQNGSAPPPPALVIAIDPSTTTYVLRDNVLCAIVPVKDPKLLAAYAVSGSGLGNDSDLTHIKKTEHKAERPQTHSQQHIKTEPSYVSSDDGFV